MYTFASAVAYFDTETVTMSELQLAQYRIERRLGAGGMGIVFLATDPRLGRQVAIKILPPGVEEGRGRKERFLREARAAGALNHPNLATIHDVGEAEVADPRLLGLDDSTGPVRIAFLVLEYVAGEDLGERLRRGPIPPAEARELGAQIADGLSAAHRAGLLHRDLKPSNLRVTPEGRVKILDFGLAKWREPERASEAAERPTADPFTTSEGIVLGTAPYASPEQALGLTLDARSDLFSLGVVLYEMLSGELPFAGSNRVALYRALVHEEPRPLLELAPGTPPALAHLVARLLEKEPERRPPTAEVVALALRDLSAGAVDLTPTTAETVPVVSPARRARRRAWLAAAAIGAGLLVTAWILLTKLAAAPASPQSLAVLPFANFTGRPELDYFGLGIAETLASQLSEVPGVNIVGPRESTGRIVARVDPRAAGRDLGVGSVLDGSVQEAGEELRVTLKLLDIRTGATLWTELFSGSRSQLFSLQARMAQAAAEAIAVPLSTAYRERLARDPTRSAKAFDLYLRARRALSDRNDISAPALALELLEEAIRLDPAFALAHAAASEASARRFERDREPADLERAQRQAERALALDPAGAEARQAKARILLLTGRTDEALRLLEAAAKEVQSDRLETELALAWEQAGDRARAEASQLRAVALRPDYWGNWNALGDFRLRGGETGPARAAFERAAGLAPPDVTIPVENLASLALLSGDTAGALAAYAKLPRPIANDETANNVGTVHFYAGEFDEAEKQFRLAARLAPGKPQYRRNLGDLYARLGRVEEARAAYGEALSLVETQLVLTPLDPELRLQRALYLARVGRCPEAVEFAGRLGGELPASAETHHALAQPLALCGARGQALERIRQALALGYPAEMLRQEDEFASLTTDADFTRLVGPS